MVRKLQGTNPRTLKGDGKGSRSELDTALPVQCMGEEGRDYLRKYIANTPFAQEILKSLEEDGYCVLPGVLSDAEVNAELDRAWNFIEKVSPSVKRNDWKTWWPCGGADPWPHAQRDMMQLHQAGWLFSELRACIAERVFERLYGTKELHVSKDGFTFQRPIDGELRRTPNDHFDQGTRWMGLQCIQSSIALTDQSENDGCFKVWPGSHIYREEILRAPRHYRNAWRTDFVIMSENEMDTLRGYGIEPRRVPVKKGDMILWRSDVAHCGAPPLGRCDTYRVVSYICCLPAALTPEPVYEQKLEAYKRLETGSHYPSREEWFEETDRHKKVAWGKYFTQPPRLTLRQRQLYGLVRYDTAVEPSHATSRRRSDSIEKASDETQDDDFEKDAVANSNNVGKSKGKGMSREKGNGKGDGADTVLNSTVVDEHLPALLSQPRSQDGKTRWRRNFM
jgi:hypothetical protein